MENLGALGVGIAGLAITLIVVFVMLSQARSNTTVAADQNATAAINTLAEAADDIPGWVPLVVIAFIGVAVLGIVRLLRQ